LTYWSGIIQPGPFVNRKNAKGLATRPNESMNLRDAVIGLLGTIVCLIASTMGALMATSPQRLVDFGLWVGRLMGFPESEIRWDGSRRREWQVGGYFVAGVSLIMAVFAFQVFLSAFQAARVAPLRETAHSSRGDLYSLLSALLMSVVGLYTIIRARALFVRMQARSGFISSRNVSSQQLGVLLFRLVGFVWLLGAVIIIWEWIVRIGG
jgi:hypothetical protein